MYSVPPAQRRTFCLPNRMAGSRPAAGRQAGGREGADLDAAARRDSQRGLATGHWPATGASARPPSAAKAPSSWRVSRERVCVGRGRILRRSGQAVVAYSALYGVIMPAVTIGSLRRHRRQTGEENRADPSRACVHVHRYTTPYMYRYAYSGRQTAVVSRPCFVCCPAESACSSSVSRPAVL